MIHAVLLHRRLRYPKERRETAPAGTARPLLRPGVSDHVASLRSCD
jgi:hypothetical protein